MRQTCDYLLRYSRINKKYSIFAKRDGENEFKKIIYTTRVLH